MSKDARACILVEHECASAISCAHHVKITKNIHQKSIKNPSKIHQKSIPNPSKNDQKSIQNPQKSILEAIRAFWSENVDFKRVPGAFWEVSWLRLGASWRCLGGV